MSELKVVAFDPGVTTGYARGIIDVDAGEMQISTGQERWDHVGQWSALTAYAPDHLIYEKFEFRQKAREGLELYSRELIGLYELYCGLNKGCTIYSQQPGTVINGYFHPGLLRKEGLWKPNFIHSNEACMHLLYWFTFGPGYKYNKKGYKRAD